MICEHVKNKRGPNTAFHVPCSCIVTGQAEYIFSSCSVGTVFGWCRPPWLFATGAPLGHPMARGSKSSKRITNCCQHLLVTCFKLQALGRTWLRITRQSEIGDQQSWLDFDQSVKHEKRNTLYWGLDMLVPASSPAMPENSDTQGIFATSCKHVGSWS